MIVLSLGIFRSGVVVSGGGGTGNYLAIGGNRITIGGNYVTV